MSGTGGSKGFFGRGLNSGALLAGRFNAFLLGPDPAVGRDPTEQMRATSIAWLSVTTLAVQFFFAGLNLWRDPTGVLSIGNLSIALFLAMNLAAYRRTQHIRAHALPAIAIILGWLIWASFRVGPGVLVWTIIIPVPTFLLLGAWQGLCWNTLFGGIVTVSLLARRLPFPEHFDVFDVPLAFLAATMLSLIGETVRAKFANALIQLSSTDSLTGLLNRRAFEEQCQAELDRARRYEHPVALLLMDADRFKAVNDNSGHAAGDRVLTRVALLVRSTLRAMDRVSRWGGEEFAALLPETDLSAAGKAAERVRRAVEGSEELSRHGVTISIGVTDISRHETIKEALERADGALYEAKRKGRNRVCQKRAPRRAKRIQRSGSV